MASSEAGLSSPFSKNLLEDGCVKVEGCDAGYGTFVGLDANLGPIDDGGGDTVDPQLTFSDPATPSGQYDVHLSDTVGLDYLFSPQPAPYDGFSFDCNIDVQRSPWLEPMEPGQVAGQHPSPLRNSCRRSVSEPPSGLPTKLQQQQLQQQQQQQQQQQPYSQAPPMTFHREHHYLGQPVHVNSMPMKSLPKNKQLRHHPYPRQTRPAPERHYKPEHRRGKTQAIASAPTSAPLHVSQYAPSLPVMPGSQFVSSRMRTPTLETAVLSPPCVDPARATPPTPLHMMSQTSLGLGNMVSIPLTVGELRDMIFEAVRQAVSGGAMKREDQNARGSPESAVLTDGPGRNPAHA